MRVCMCTSGNDWFARFATQLSLFYQRLNRNDVLFEVHVDCSLSLLNLGVDVLRPLSMVFHLIPWMKAAASAHPKYSPTEIRNRVHSLLPYLFVRVVWEWAEIRVEIVWLSPGEFSCVVFKHLTLTGYWSPPNNERYSAVV